MQRNEIFDAVVGEIELVGGKVDDVRQGKGGHLVLYWTTAAGTKAVQTIQRYSGNYRSIRNARSSVRRMGL